MYLCSCAVKGKFGLRQSQNISLISRYSDSFGTICQFKHIYVYLRSLDKKRPCEKFHVSISCSSTIITLIDKVTINILERDFSFMFLLQVRNLIVWRIKNHTPKSSVKP